MKKFLLPFIAILISYASFGQTGVYLFGTLQNAPSYPVGIYTTVYGQETTNTIVYSNAQGEIPISWIELPSLPWDSIATSFVGCDSTAVQNTVNATDALPSIVDVYISLEFCAEAGGCTDYAALNYDPNAAFDDGSCQYPSTVDNDLCANATAIFPGTLAISNIGATLNEGIFGECWGFGNGEGEQSSIWYSFTTPDFPASIHLEALSDFSNTLTDTQFGIFEECGGDMIYCDGNSGAGLLSSFHFYCGDLDENTEYLLMIDGWNGDAGTAFLAYSLDTLCAPPQILGCTDTLATNYDPAATVDDGSCAYPCAAAQLVLDGAGDFFFALTNEGGWNSIGNYSGEATVIDLCLPDGCYTFAFESQDSLTGAAASILQGNQIIGFFSLWGMSGTYQFSIGNETCGNDSIGGCTDPNALNYNPIASFDDSSCQYPEPCDANEILITVHSGSWASEISWAILQDSTVIVPATDQGYVNNSTYLSNVCLPNGCYTIALYDSYGDGWNGGSFTASLGGNTLATGTVNAPGTYAELILSVNDSSCVIFEEIPGCTDAEAINYNPDATINDGSCQYEGPCLANEVTVIIQTGNSWGNEVTWHIEQDSELLATGGDGAYQNNSVYELTTCLPDGCYNFQLLDSFGDGWNGATFQVLYDSMIVASGTLPAGNFGSVPFGINSASCADSTGSGGCTDPDALNYDWSAIYDDGTCEYPEPCSYTLVSDGFACNEQFLFLETNNAQEDNLIWLVDGLAVPADSNFYYFSATEAGIYEVCAAINSGECEGQVYCETITVTEDCFNTPCPEFIQVDTVGNCAAVFNVYPFDGQSNTDFMWTIEGDGFFEVLDNTPFLFYSFPANGEYTICYENLSGDCENFFICESVYITGCVSEPLVGCTDPQADNYDPEATEDDGSCTYSFGCQIDFQVLPDSTGENVIWVLPSASIFDADSITWSFGDGQTSNELFPTHAYEEGGTYTLCVSAVFSSPTGSICEISHCIDISSEMLSGAGLTGSGFQINVIDESTALGIFNIENRLSLSLYPNPATEQLTISFEMDGSAAAELMVIDITGKALYFENIFTANGENNHQIDVSNLSQGIYLLQLRMDGSVATERFAVTE